jgi:hypothetical protein
MTEGGIEIDRFDVPRKARSPIDVTGTSPASKWTFAGRTISTPVHKPMTTESPVVRSRSEI